MADKYPHINKSYISNVNDLQSKTENWFTQGMDAKFFYMRTWLQNINFHAGNQWLTYDASRQMFELDPILEDETRLVINKILPAIRMAVGKLAQDRKRPIVIHRTQDEDAIESAKVATRLLEHLRRVNHELYIEKQVITWGALAGKGITKKWYNTKTDEVITDIIPPFEFVVPPNVLTMDKMPWACHARYETREWVFERYGLEVEGSSDWGQYGMFLAAVKNIMEDGNYTGVYTQGLENNVLVKDWWIRPCKAYPDGALIIEVNDKIIYADRNPYMDPKVKAKSGEVLPWKDYYWPFAEFDFFDAPYRYWPISLVENMIDSQKWVNEIYSNNLENVQYANSPTYWAQSGSVVADDVSMKPGSVNEYTGQQPPVQNQARAIDPIVFTQAEKLEQSMSELSGIHFFGPGSMPPGVHAAAALAIINEQDQIAAMAVSVNHEKWIRTCAEQTLYLIKVWGPDKMLIQVMGDEGQWEVVEFKKAFINGGEEIKIESKQELAQDKMTKFDQIVKLMTTPGDDGKPLIDTETGLRMLELEKDAGLVTPRFLNRNMQANENQKLWKGEPVEVFSFEDHKTHVEVLLEEMLTLKYKKASKHVRDTFMQHYQDHENFLAQAQTPSPTQSPQQPPVAPQQPPMTPPMGGGMPPQMMPAPQHMPMPLSGPTGLAGPLQAGFNNMMNTVHPGG